MKDTLVEIKDNLQGNVSRADETGDQADDLEHKGTKINQISTRNRRIQKRRVMQAASLTT